MSLSKQRKKMEVDEDLEQCPECDELVLPDDICSEHQVCLWCDVFCKLWVADEEHSEDDS